MPLESGGMCTGVDLRNHLCAPGLPAGRLWAGTQRREGCPHPEQVLVENGWGVTSSEHSSARMGVGTILSLVRSATCPGLVFKAHRLLYHSSLGSRVIKKMKKVCEVKSAPRPAPGGYSPLDSCIT